eukprot:TRINITY_DN36104_c0_g1_i1.p1 TRINITY_DN36104_c0_g1~~TRINITY_DN36104_c0_g1_i1.p1  ORF type:complete len:184 (-),score=49.99 TRINITY_DN36104_c0_g1_i1:74-625(-)
MSLERLQAIFRSAYSKHLLATNIVASGGLLLLGDVIQQNIELYKGLHTKGSYDWNRSGKMLLMGLFHGAPRHYFYVYLDRYIPGRTISCAVKKIFFDQTVISPFVDSTFLYGISIMESQTPAQAWSGLQDKFPKVYLCDCLLWPPVQMINFTLVPLRFRVLFVNVMNLAWNTVLSYFQHQYQP